MENSLRFSALMLILAIGSCTTSQKITGSWINKEALKSKSYKQVFISVLSGNLAARTTLENDLSAAATAKGIENVKSLDVFPPNTNLSRIDSNMIRSKIREMGCDAIFTVAVLDSKTDTRYIPGSTTYMPGYGGYYGGYRGGYYGYYNYYGTTIYNPGYYTTDKTYFLEGNLFDAATGKLLYSVQSELYNPSDIATESKLYTMLVLKQMEKDGLLEK